MSADARLQEEMAIRGDLTRWIGLRAHGWGLEPMFEAGMNECIRVAKGEPRAAWHSTERTPERAIELLRRMLAWAGPGTFVPGRGEARALIEQHERATANPPGAR